MNYNIPLPVSAELHSVPQQKRPQSYNFLLSLTDIPESTMKPVMEEFQAELERKLNDKEEL